MATYSISDILTWADAAQPLAAIGENKRKYTQGGTVDLDLHLKIYIEKKSLAWQYSQNPTDSDGILYEQGNYVYALLLPYLFAAQQATGGGGQIVNPTTPIVSPVPYDFDVDGSSFIASGATSKQFPDVWKGKNILFIRGYVPQTQVSNTATTYYSWDSANAILNLFGPAPNNGAAVETENLQIYAVL